MSFLDKGRKPDLIMLARELDVDLPSGENLTKAQLKKTLVNSEGYDEELARGTLENIIEDRLEKAEAQKAEQELELKKLELEQERLKMEAEKELRKIEAEKELRKMEAEKELRKMEAEKELKKIEAERERYTAEKNFELEKLRLTNQKASSGNGNTQIRSEGNYVKLKDLMQKYNSQEGDISFFLILFERQARRIELSEEHWMLNLLALLPYEITEIIAREPEEKANDYKYVKELLLKRFKLTTECFRQKFYGHSKSTHITWKDFAYELRNYFQGWVTGCKVTKFDEIQNLIISEQLKRKVPFAVQEHFVDDWTNFINPEDLAEKLDQYENVRGDFRAHREKVDHKTVTPGWNNEKFTTSRTDQKANSVNRSEEHRDYKCFNCNNYGHISKDCPKQKTATTYRKHGAEWQTQGASLNVTTEVTRQEEKRGSPYMKKAKVGTCGEVTSLIDTGSSCCLLKLSAAAQMGLTINLVANDLYGLGSQNVPATKTIGVAVVNLEIDGVVGRNVEIFIVPDNAQPVDLLVGRTWTDLPEIAYAKVGDTLRIGYVNEMPFANLTVERFESKICMTTADKILLHSNAVNFVRSKVEGVQDGLVMLNNTTENYGCLIEVINEWDRETQLKETGQPKLKEHVCTVNRKDTRRPIELEVIEGVVEEAVDAIMTEENANMKTEEAGLREGDGGAKKEDPCVTEDDVYMTEGNANVKEEDAGMKKEDASDIRKDDAAMIEGYVGAKEDDAGVMKERFDRKRSSTLTWEPGEIVVVRRSARSTGEPTKTQPKYRGPMVVTEVLPSDTCD